MPTNFISSPKNPRLKEIVRLRDAAYRREKGLFIIEGVREVRLALESGFSVREIFICPGYFNPSLRANGVSEAIPTEIASSSRHFVGTPRNDHAGIPLEVAKARKTKIIELDKKAYEKIAFGERKEGIIAVAVSPRFCLSEIKIKPKAMIMVVEGLEKPGNLGAIARSADASGVCALIAADTKGDIYNPNAIRSSLGAIFSVKTLKESSAKVIAWLKANNIKIISAVVGAGLDYTRVDFNQSLAIVLGSEENGLSRIWRDNSDYQVRLPMSGRVDSLNVSVTAGILLYEALRQRSGK